VEQDREFVSAQAAVGHDSGNRADTRGHGAQHVVARRVAIRIVDMLEPVEIEQRQPGCASPSPPRSCAMCSPSRARIARRLSAPVKASREACSKLVSARRAARRSRRAMLARQFQPHEIGVEAECHDQHGEIGHRQHQHHRPEPRAIQGEIDHAGRQSGGERQAQGAPAHGPFEHACHRHHRKQHADQERCASLPMA
jgi:hypothetical protein